MLDTSIPYFVVVMARPRALPPMQAPALPHGYAYRFYAPGDAASWAAIKASVNEFDDSRQALAYFEKEFLPYEAALAQRMVFVTDAQGMPVATATAWEADDPLLGRCARLHWVSAMPQVQGKGIGRAVTAKALSVYPEVSPPGDIWLTTQTWSHVAIGLYLSQGFRAHKTQPFMDEKNEYAQAEKVLKDVMPPEVYRQFVETAIG